MTMEEDIFIKDILRKALVAAGYEDVRVACDSKAYTELTKRPVLFCIAAYKNGEIYYVYGNAVCRTGENSKLTSLTIIPAMDLAANVTTNSYKVHLDYDTFTNDHSKLEAALKKFVDIL